MEYEWTEAIVAKRVSTYERRKKSNGYSRIDKYSGLSDDFVYRHHFAD